MTIYQFLTLPSSYVHAIVKFKSGLIKLVAHDTDIEFPSKIHWKILL